LLFFILHFFLSSCFPFSAPSTQLRTQSRIGFRRYSTVRQDGLIKQWKTSVRTQNISGEHLQT
jgi:hypothetical protein